MANPSPFEMSDGVDHDRIALAVRQPWAELIVRGAKTVEVRSGPVQLRGPIYIYAARAISDLPDAIVAATRFGVEIDALPRGVIVGTAELVDARPATTADVEAALVSTAHLAGKHAWELARTVRFPQPLRVRFKPYGIWFYPFRRGRSVESF